MSSDTEASAGWRRWLAGALAALALLAAMLASHDAMQRRTDLFDDAFIYLHISQNAVESGTWRYYVLSDRPALLASSPVRIGVLTVANAITWASGQRDRSLATAKATLWCSALVAFALFAPWWRGHWRAYAALGAVYFWLATGLSGITSFESGLLLLWAASAMRCVATATRIGTGLAVLLWLGPLIRIDMALVMLPLLALLASERGLLRDAGGVFRRLALTGLALALAWTGLCVALGVHPVPATYLTKSVLPFLFEDATFLEKLLERAASSLTLDTGPAARGLTAMAAGLLLAGLAGRATALPGDAPAAARGWLRVRRALRLAVPLLVAYALFRTMPANSWWYYENALLALLGLAWGWALARGNGRASRALCALGVVATLALFAPRTSQQGHLPWSWDPARDGRTPGYLALAGRAMGDGRYDLPGIGPAILKGPEIGIIAYFSGAGAFQWDTAGLAQAPDDPAVRASRLRYAYPRRFLETGRDEALRLAWRGEVATAWAWAIGSADVASARATCNHVDAAAQLCIITDPPLRDADRPAPATTPSQATP
ncbi:MAG: hypothetical protein NT046_05470 [Arenimonas sp.]|nr:hypothetical protein [Arenimonas sp.]